MKSPLYGILVLTRPLLVYDLETTSTDPATARICQMAMRIHKPDGTLKVWKSLVNPGIPMPKSAEETHGITDDTIAAGCSSCHFYKKDHPRPECAEWKPVPTFAQLAAHDSFLRGFLDADFAGYHINYDLRVTAEEFQRTGLVFDYSGAAIIDGLRLWQLLEPRTLTDAVAYFAKRKLDGAHDAMVDVEGTEEAIIGQLTGHHRSGIFRDKTIQELHEMQWPRDPNALDSRGKFIYADNVLVFSFGKWKGQPVAEHLDYVQWMTGPKASFEPEIRKWCERILSGGVLLRRIPDAEP